MTGTDEREMNGVVFDILCNRIGNLVPIKKSYFTRTAPLKKKIFEIKDHSTENYHHLLYDTPH